MYIDKRSVVGKTIVGSVAMSGVPRHCVSYYVPTYLYIMLNLPKNNSVQG